MKRWLLGILLVAVFPLAASAQQGFETDTIKTSAGDLTITFIGRGTLIFTFAERVIHVDPWTRLADYTKLPQADLILLTHEHRDHLDLRALELVRTEKAVVVLTETCARQVKDGIVMRNGEVKTVEGLNIETVPAYNMVHMRKDGRPFHPKGVGNGYAITFGDKKIYVAGDTENTPEMNKLRDIDIAFLPMNVPYTMRPEMVADAAKTFKPKILYPYHYGKTDTSKLVELLKDVKGIEVRIRNME